jgi:lysophospholipase L1-like esterase
MKFNSVTGLAQFLTLVAFVGNALAGSAWSQNTTADTPLTLLRNSRTIVCLGDSITAAGQYVSLLEAWMLTQQWPAYPKVINAGLPSETVSGLSEEGHAGGSFPRPNLHERLQRLLAITKPDLVMACYGINCGIYQPLDAQRFEKFQQGMHLLKQQVESAGARLIILTPPFYDDHRKPLSGFSYNSVLDEYASWLIRQRQQGWLVIDLHTAMTKEVLHRRKNEPDYTLQPDGVHPDEHGHWCIARKIIAELGETISEEITPTQMVERHKLDSQVLKLLEQRMALRRNAYVSAAGHKRPGIEAGLPIEVAENRVREIDAKINAMLQPISKQ